MKRSRKNMEAPSGDVDLLAKVLQRVGPFEKPRKERRLTRAELKAIEEQHARTPKGFADKGEVPDRSGWRNCDPVTGKPGTTVYAYGWIAVANCRDVDIAGFVASSHRNIRRLVAEVRRQAEEIRALRREISERKPGRRGR